VAGVCFNIVGWVARQEFRTRQYFPAGIYRKIRAFRSRTLLHLASFNYGSVAGLWFIGQTPGRLPCVYNLSHAP